MNKKFISMIAASLMLAAPCLNAGLDGLTKLLLAPATGNYGLSRSNKFDTRSFALAGAPAAQASSSPSLSTSLSNADRWISERLPERMRLSPGMLEKCYEAKKHTGIIRPVIFMNMDKENTDHGNADSLRGIVRINEAALLEYDKALKDAGYQPEGQGTVVDLYHECAHIYHGHQMSLLCALSQCSLILGEIGAGLSLLGTLSSSSFLPHSTLLRSSQIAALWIIAGSTYYLESARLRKPARRKYYEYEANNASYKTMASHKPEHLKTELKILIKNGNGNKRRGEDKYPDIYPTNNESIAMIYSALKGANQHQAFANDMLLQIIVHNQYTLTGIKQVLGEEYAI